MVVSFLLLMMMIMSSLPIDAATTVTSLRASSARTATTSTTTITAGVFGRIRGSSSAAANDNNDNKNTNNNENDATTTTTTTFQQEIQSPTTLTIDEETLKRTLQDVREDRKEYYGFYVGSCLVSYFCYRLATNHFAVFSSFVLLYFLFFLLYNPDYYFKLFKNSENNDGEDESLLDNLQNITGNIQDEVKDTIDSDPDEWSTGQIIGVAVAAVVAILIICCCFYCCFCRKRGSDGGGGGGTSSKKEEANVPPYKLKRPYVVRSGTASKVDAENNLPLGVRLHGAEKLHDAGLNGEGIRVAVIDSGIDKSHPGFNGVVKKQKWYRSGTPLSKDDHGTHVAGTIHFMAPKAELYDYRVFGEKGEVDGDTAIAQSIRQAVEDGCHIINMSLRVSYPIVPSVRDAVKYAHANNVIMVCAAGNSGDGDPLTNELYAYVFFIFYFILGGVCIVVFVR